MGTKLNPALDISHWWEQDSFMLMFWKLDINEVNLILWHTEDDTSSSSNWSGVWGSAGHLSGPPPNKADSGRRGVQRINHLGWCREKKGQCVKIKEMPKCISWQRVKANYSCNSSPVAQSKAMHSGTVFRRTVSFRSWNPKCQFFLTLYFY